jgi:hypothetical protein
MSKLAALSVSAQQPGVGGQQDKDLGAYTQKHIPTKEELPNAAAVPLNVGLTGAKTPPARELAREARRLRKLNRKRGIKPPSTRSARELPAAYESPYVTKPARLQGNNDCWAFGTVEVMETAFLKAAQSNDYSLHFAPQAVVDCNPYGYTAEYGGWWSYIVYTDGFHGRG